MKTIYIVAFENGIASTVVAPLEILRYADQLSRNTVTTSSVPVLNVKVATIGGRPVTCSGGIIIRPDCSVKEIGTADLVVICSPGVMTDSTLLNHTNLIPIISRLYEAGTCLAGICTGSFFIAESGLLDNRQATTHWNQADQFSARYPQVTLLPERIITDDSNILCAGGVYSAQDLSLYLVEKYCGREIAIQCAKSLVIEAGRNSQSVYAIFSFQKKHGDAEILNIQTWLESHFQEDLAIDHLAVLHGMSARNFKRRFKKATGDAPLVYLQRLRIEAARHALEHSNKTVTEISILVGYHNVDFFRTLFRRYLDMSPSSYRQKYRFGIPGT